MAKMSPSKQIVNITHFNNNLPKAFEVSEVQMHDKMVIFLSMREDTGKDKVRVTLSINDAEISLISMKLQAYLFQKQFKETTSSP